MNESFGDVLREARLRRNMSQQDLASQISVSQQSVANWERGTSFPRIERIEDLQRIFSNDPAFCGHPSLQSKETMVIEALRAKTLQVEEQVNNEYRGYIAKMQADKDELHRALPPALHQYLELEIGVGAAMRTLDYVSPRYCVELKRMPSHPAATWQRYSDALVQLAVAREISKSAYPQRHYVLMIVGVNPPDIQTNPLQRVMFDAGVLGIQVLQQPSWTAAGEAIGALEKMAEQLGRPNPSLGDAMPQDWIPDKP